MTREKLQENYTNCTAPLKHQRFWDYAMIVMHVVFTVCIVSAYVKAIGNGTEFIESRFIPYSVWSAVFGFCTYGMIRSIMDIKAINKELKLFDDVHQSALEALEATECEKRFKDKHEVAADDSINLFLERWDFRDSGDLKLIDVIQHRVHEVNDLTAVLREIKVTAESDSWPEGAYYVGLSDKFAKVNKSIMMQMYQDFVNFDGHERYSLIAIPAPYVDAYVGAYLKIV